MMTAAGIPRRRLRILGPDGNPLPRSPRNRIGASYDNAATTTDNTRHWAHADNLSARAANSLAVRKKLRERARYEIANNSYARGITLTLAGDTIGTGPRLQLGFDEGETRINAAIESAWRSWSRGINLAEKCRVLRLAKCGDGEAFALIGTNPRARSRIKLDLATIECDRVTEPYWDFLPESARRNDGIDYDEYGNPTTYHVLKTHPGDTGLLLLAEQDQYNADAIVHLFRSDRPGQQRGVPEVTPALGLFADLRRFTEATIAAAETAADFAGVMHSDTPPIDPDDSDVEDAVEVGDAFELEKAMGLTLPRGWKFEQFKAQHPATTFDMFVDAMLRELARCVNMPFGIAAGDMSDYNYASGRLDDRIYLLAIRLERDYFEIELLDRLLAAWWQEAILVRDLIPPSLRRLAVEEIPHEWRWDRRPHADPVKEEMARKLRLEIADGTLAEFAAEDGVDPDGRIQQRGREIKQLREAGIAVGPQPKPQPPGAR